MANKEVRIPHSEIRDPQKVTQVTKDAMDKVNCNVHVNEVVDMYDDHDKGFRVLNIEKKGDLFYGYNVTQERWDKIFSKSKEE